MYRSRFLITAAALAAALLPQSGVRAAPACPFDGETAAWTREALAAWDLVRDTRLDLPSAAPPELVLFDASCAFRLSATGVAPNGYRLLDETVTTSAGPLKVWGAPHAGEVRLPDGEAVPARPLAFASQNAGGRVFFVMALPSLWTQTLEQANRADLLKAVLVHEISHVRQVGALGRRLDALTAAGVLAPDSDDDVVQKTFGEDPAFAAAAVRETDLLYRAADATSLAETRRLAAEALASMDVRRARAFTGDKAPFAEVEDVFLTFEGAGNWAGFAWLSDPKGAALPRAEAVDLMRGGRKWWSQEQGLALFLTLDRLDPDWPDKVYGEQGALATDLLRTALNR